MDSLSLQSTVNAHQVSVNAQQPTGSDIVSTSDSLHSVIVNLAVEDSNKTFSGLNRAIHAQALTWLKKGKPEISALIHKSQQSPISISEIIQPISSPITKSGNCTTINRVFFKVNFLQGYLLPILLAGIETERTISLNNHNFNIIGVDTLPGLGSQAKTTTYQELEIIVNLLQQSS